MDHLAENPRVAIGGNNPPEDPTPFQQLEARKDELFKGINKFVTDNPDLETQELIDKVSDFQVQLVTLEKDIDKQREAEKRPHLDAANAIQNKYKPLLLIMQKGIERVRGRLSGAMIAMNKKRDDARRAAEAEQQRLREEADAAAREAERLATLADDGAPLPAGTDVMGAEQKAIELEQAAEAQQAEVRELKGNVKGGTGEVDGKKKTVALHTYYSANVTEPRAALNYFFAQAATKPKILNLIQELADAAVRKAATAKDFDNIPPGVEVTSRQQAQ